MPSNTEILKALDETKAHWFRLAYGLRKEGESIGAKHCPLCNLFERTCDDCPIYLHTGQRYCDGTPYKAVEVLAVNYTGRNTPFLDSPEFKSVANAEYKFICKVAKEWEKQFK